MSAVHVEERFEDAIEASLLAAGWHRGASKDYDVALGLDTAQLFAFISATQGKAWSKVLGYYVATRGRGDRRGGRGGGRRRSGPVGLLRGGPRASRKPVLLRVHRTPKAKTLELFGELGEDQKHRAFHIYSMRQAIDEGFILDALRNYVTYATYYKLANATPSGDREVDKRKAAAELARFASLHPSNMAQRAEIIVEHFRAHSARRLGGRAKAMVVTRSRLHAVRTRAAIRKYIETKGYQGLHALVAFSGVVEDGGVASTEAMVNGFSEAALSERFTYTAADDAFAGREGAAQDREYHVLVVAEKY